MGYSILYAVATLALYQGQVLRYVASVLDLFSSDGLLILLTLETVQAVLTIVVMATLGAVSVWLMKFVGAGLMLVNAASAYYMSAYGVVIDKSMIANILNTDRAEAGGLLHPLLLVSLALWGVLPAGVALWLPVRRHSVRALAGAVAVLALGAGVVWSASGVWLWFDQHNSAIGPRILPWSYLGNSARYAAEVQRRNRVARLLPDAVLIPQVDAGQTLVVVVIGEAARRDHLEYFGYDRPTNPFTRDLGVIALPEGRSCATNTIDATACILSHLGSDANVTDPWEPLPSFTARAGIDTVVRVNNAGLPNLAGVSVETRQDFAPPCADTDCAGTYHDDALLNGLAERLALPAQRRLLVLHMNGSHGPSYFNKYPAAFEVFTPTCQTTLINSCDPQAVVNAYDNSIRYSDWVLARLIEMLQAQTDTAVLLLYVSDHGQSLGENGVYLHGLPNALAPEAQRFVPFLVWMNDAFASARSIDRTALVRPIPDPQGMIFHTVLGALGVSGPTYRPENDLMRQESR